MEDLRAKERIWGKDFTIICLSNFFVFLGFQMLMPTLPLYVHALGGSDFFLGLMVGAFTFSSLLTRPWSGMAVDTFGRGLILLCGLAVFIFSVWGMAFFTSLALLFGLRLLQGLGFGTATTAAGTVATDLIPPQRRGEGMGYYGLSLNLAMAIGPALGLVMVQRTSFFNLFTGAAFLGLIALILTLFIRYQPVSPPTRVTVAASEVASPVPLSFWDRWVERRSIRPSILMGLICVTFGAMGSFLPLYALEEGVGHIEWYFFLYAVCITITRPLAGKWYDKKGVRSVFLPGAFSIFVSMLLLTQLHSLWLLLLAAVLNGAGFGAVQPALQAWAVEAAPYNRKGMANATFYSFLDMGIGLGAMTFGAMAGWVGYSGIYYGAAVAVLAAILLHIPFTRKSTSP